MLIEITYNVTDVFMSTTETPVYVEISFEQPGGSAAVWGSITGTLSNQTDLQNALNLKVPYTGATTNVNLGEYELKAGQVTLDTSPTGTAAVGTIRWNDTTGTSETTLKGGNVIIKNGVDLVARVVNKVSPNTTLTKAAYQAVRVSGAQGQRLAIALAQANNDANSADTIGLVTETIATNQEGFIMTVGQLEGINTTGSLQGETWVDGDVLYLSPTTAGAITNVKPTAVTGHIVVIGYVEYAHVNNGKIYVKVMNGWELDELHNVSIITPTNNQGLFYNSSNSLWENKTISTALGYTPVPTTRNITINGVTYDLSADRTWTVAGGISGSGAAGQVTYWDGTSSVSGSNNLFWDNTNGRLGIGTNVPAAKVDINLGTGSNTNSVYIRNTSSTGYSSVTLFDNRNNNSFVGQWGLYGDAFSGNASNMFFYNSAGGGIGFYVGNGSNPSADLRLLIGNNGNIGIGTGTTVPAVRLQVIGDTLLRGSGNTSATTALTVQNSSSEAILIARNDRLVNLYQTIYGTNASGSEITAFAESNNVTDFAGLNLLFRNSRAGSISQGAFLFSGINVTAINGTMIGINFTKGFTPTSGTADYRALQISPTINQTGGANGITRGLYVNPTLTAAADFRAIETSAGNVLFGSNFFWDNANGRLGIGTNAPASTLQVNGIATYGTSSSGWRIIIDTTGSTNPGGYINYTLNDNFTYYSQYAQSGFINYATTPGSAWGHRWISQGTNSMALSSNGNLSVGTTSNLGVRLGVVGDTLLRGSGATSATTALTVQNSSSTNLFTVRNDGLSTFGGNVLVSLNQNTNTSLTVSNTTVGTLGVAELVLQSTSVAAFGKTNSGYATFKTIVASDFYMYNAGAGDMTFLNDFATGRIKFASGGVSTAQMTLFANGNFAINSGVTDLGVRFGVVGDTLLRGSGATSSTTALTVQNSNSTNLFTVRNDGFVGIGTSSPAHRLEIIGSDTLNPMFNVLNNAATQYVPIFETNAPNLTATQAGYIAIGRNRATNNQFSLGFFYAGNGSTSNRFDLNFYGTSQLLSVTAGGNIGINNNAPTARLDIAASVTTAASLRIRSGTAPTTPNDGDIWFDGTDIKMRIAGITKTFTLI